MPEHFSEIWMTISLKKVSALREKNQHIFHACNANFWGGRKHSFAKQTLKYDVDLYFT